MRPFGELQLGLARSQPAHLTPNPSGLQGKFDSVSCFLWCVCSSSFLCLFVLSLVRCVCGFLFAVSLFQRKNGHTNIDSSNELGHHLETNIIKAIGPPSKNMIPSFREKFDVFLPIYPAPLLPARLPLPGSRGICLWFRPGSAQRGGTCGTYEEHVRARGGT